MSAYAISDFRNISWEEYGETLNSLYDKVHRYINGKNIIIDAIVPILRGGAFPGTFLAYKLHSIHVLPVQYKYLTDVNGKFSIKRIGGVSDEAFMTSENMTFLVVENNHCFGTTAKLAIENIKKMNPSCHIVYAAAYMDYSYQEMPQAEAVFFGKLTNETRGLTYEKAIEMGISNDMSLFPWEDINEELAMVNEEGFTYS